MKMNKEDDKDEFPRVISKLIGEEKLGEAINYLKKIIETDHKNEEALVLMEQIKKILEYQNRDIFASTNLNMDPWLE